MKKAILLKAYLILIVFNAFQNQINCQSFSFGIINGFGSYSYNTASDKAYLKNFPEFKFQKFSYGIQARVQLESNLLLNYQVRYFYQSMSAEEVVLPAFIYADNWADVDIEFSRIQNFIGIGYSINFGSFSVVPQFEFFMSFSNNYDVEVQVNPNRVNTPVSVIEEPNFNVGFNEYGSRFSLEFGYEISKKITALIKPNVIYGEMELVSQDSFTFTGGDNITKGLGLDFGFYYVIN